MKGVSSVSSSCIVIANSSSASPMTSRGGTKTPAAVKMGPKIVQRNLIMLIATRIARIAAMSKLIMTMMFIPRAWTIAALNTTESTASCIRSR